jgi:hypothetical protein
VARNGDVALWARGVLVLIEGEKDVAEAPRIAALTQEWNRTRKLELACLGGDMLVGVAEDVFRLHCTPFLLLVARSLPIPVTTNLALCAEPKENPRVGAREDRLAKNETLFREVNERVAEVASGFIETETQSEPVEFACECGRADCTEPIAMTLVEYEAARAEPTRFVVVPGHEQPEIETVVERHPTYLVVEKREEDAEEIARETDPRS